MVTEGLYGSFGYPDSQVSLESLYGQIWASESLFAVLRQSLPPASFS